MQICDGFGWFFWCGVFYLFIYLFIWWWLFLVFFVMVILFFFFTWERDFLTGWWILAPLQDLCSRTAFNQMIAEHVIAVGVAIE